MITPNEHYAELGKALGTPDLWFKREDLHPLGSHKGRSIPRMIDAHMKTGSKSFAISSSGNAALAAGLYIQELNKNGSEISLDILVGQNIAPKKLEKVQALKSDLIRVSIHDRPKQALIAKTKDGETVSLRQSEDDTALVGYTSLAEELLEIPDLQAVFIGTSSGTTAQALAQFFIQKKLKIEVHIIQTPACHPITDAFNILEGNLQENESDEKSIADAIVDRVALRKDTLAPLIEKTGGTAWIANNENISAAIDMVKKETGLSISTNSALSVAGLMQAVYRDKTWKGAVACLICGD